MEKVMPIEDQVLDRFLEKLKGDKQVSPGLVTALEELRRDGALAQPDKLLDAYHRGVSTDATN